MFFFRQKINSTESFVFRSSSHRNLIISLKRNKKIKPTCAYTYFILFCWIDLKTFVRIKYSLCVLNKNNYKQFRTTTFTIKRQPNSTNERTRKKKHGGKKEPPKKREKKSNNIKIKSSNQKSCVWQNKSPDIRRREKTRVVRPFKEATVEIISACVFLFVSATIHFEFFSYCSFVKRFQAFFFFISFDKIFPRFNYSVRFIE